MMGCDKKDNLVLPCDTPEGHTHACAGQTSGRALAHGREAGLLRLSDARQVSKSHKWLIKHQHYLLNSSMPSASHGRG